LTHNFTNILGAMAFVRRQRGSEDVRVTCQIHKTA
jgi:hypothetical protein